MPLHIDYHIPLIEIRNRERNDEQIYVYDFALKRCDYIPVSWFDIAIPHDKQYTSHELARLSLDAGYCDGDMWVHVMTSRGEFLVQSIDIEYKYVARS